MSSLLITYSAAGVVSRACGVPATEETRTFIRSSMLDCASCCSVESGLASACARQHAANAVSARLGNLAQRDAMTMQHPSAEPERDQFTTSARGSPTRRSVETLHRD